MISKLDEKQTILKTHMLLECIIMHRRQKQIENGGGGHGVNQPKQEAQEPHRSPES
jgi:hypothetical protein